MDPENITPDPQTPAPPPPAAAPVIPVADLSGALVDAWRQIQGAQPQQQQQIQNPIDAMTPAERQALSDRALTDPIGVARYVSDMGAQAERQRLHRDAAPLIHSQANTIVELYKTRKQRSDKYFNQVEPLFDALMVGVDITPLVTMNDATRNRELDMRWKNARADVLEVEMRKVKPDPMPMGNGGGAPAAPTFEDDPWLANMKREYNYTDDQLKDILGVE